MGVTLSEPSVQYHRTLLPQQYHRPAYFRRLETNHFTGYIISLLDAAILLDTMGFAAYIAIMNLREPLVACT